MANRRLPRASAFHAHGVTLKDPEASWSGVSAHDGGVVLGMKASEVRVTDDCCSCLLWAAGLRWPDAASKGERRVHCQLALLRGEAQGLLAYGEALGMDPNEPLSLRVLHIGGEYWAKWGCGARRHADAYAGEPLAERDEMRLAGCLS